MHLEERKVDKQSKHLQDDLALLKQAIEEAIVKGQKSLRELNDTCVSGTVSDKDVALPRTRAGLGVGGWVEDF